MRQEIAAVVNAHGIQRGAFSMKRVRHWRGRRDLDRLPFTPSRIQRRSHSVKTSTPYGTLIRERKDGVLYFTAKDEKGVSRHWTVTPDGKTWLTSQGIRDGKRVSGQIITALLKKGHAVASNKTSRRTAAPKYDMQKKLEKLVRDTRQFEERRDANRKAKETAPPAKRRETPAVKPRPQHAAKAPNSMPHPKPAPSVVPPRQAATGTGTRRASSPELAHQRRKFTEDQAIDAVMAKLQHPQRSDSAGQEPAYVPGVPRKHAKKAAKRARRKR